MKVVFFSVLFAIAVVASPIQDQEVAPAFNARADTRFLLFTRFNPTIGQVININDMSSVAGTHWSPSRPTRVLIHGWQGDASASINFLLTAAYLRNYDVNIIVCDWGIGANNINYIASRNQVPHVGAVVAELLDNLHSSGNLPSYDRVNLIGHSLGAHIAGFAGKRATFGRCNTIVGLDPAGPLFSADNPNNRLDAGDALYVEVIHTDTSNLGIGYPIGHADFFPNGGENMPGCLTSICHHDMAIPYFAESLNSNQLMGRRCLHMDQMNANQCTGAHVSMGGEPSNFRNNINGIFRMRTNANQPFGTGQYWL